MAKCEREVRNPGPPGQKGASYMVKETTKLFETKNTIQVVHERKEQQGFKVSKGAFNQLGFNADRPSLK